MPNEENTLIHGGDDLPPSTISRSLVPKSSSSQEPHSFGPLTVLTHMIYGRRFICYLLLALGFLFCIAFTVSYYLTQSSAVEPHGKKLSLQIYSLNNWAIPANPDKEARLEALKGVFANATFDVFLLQGLWMEYDHNAIAETLSSHLGITGFRELGSSSMCDGRITRAGCSGLSIVYNKSNLEKVSSSFNLFSYRGSILTTDGTLGKGLGRVRFKTPDNFILDVFTTHIHDSDPFYQNLQTSELMGFIFKSPADLLVLGACLQSTPEEHPYTSILNYKVINAAESFNPKDWSNPSLHGTFNMPDNPYSSPKDSKPKIVDYVFLGSPLKYDIQVHDFHRPSFSRGTSNNVSLSNHEPIGVNIEVNA